MTWLKTFPETVGLERGCVAAIGNFDGVHMGHVALLREAREEADTLGVPLVVLTFEPHPRSVLQPNVKLERLTDLDEKVSLLGDEGVDGVAVLGFDAEVAKWAPDAFIEEALVGWLGVRMVVVGENFKFGHKAAGNLDSLRKDGWFGVRAVKLVKDKDGSVISSSGIRKQK